ncbi:MAG TPA: PAS domain S-box protein [Gemmatimonadales bacterium]|nr:PAS domain S-box protein [Gemmatimonadales bacterium]
MTRQPTAGAAPSGVPAYHPAEPPGWVDPAQARLQADAFASSGEAMFTLSFEGRITSWNQAAATLYGQAQPDQVGSPLAEVFGGKEAERLAALFPELRRGTPMMRLETVHPGASGEMLDISLSLWPIMDGSGTPVGVGGIARDITSRKIEEEQFRLAIEANPLGLVIVDAAGTIQALNHTGEQLLRYAREELVGQPVEVLVPVEWRALHAAHRQDFMTAPRRRGMSERVANLDVQRKDGSVFPANIALTPLVTRRGPMVMACITDITGAREAAAAEARQRRELQRSNQELAQFAYVASHDLQEPLRMVASYTQLLAERYQGRLDERADKYIRYAVEGASRMQRLVSDLLAISRVDSQARAPRPVDAGVVLARVLADMAATIEARGADVKADKLPVVLADEVQLGQVLQNLVGNALKFVADRPPRVRISAEPDGAQWRFAVEDNGIGIEPEYAERVFEMFQRLHPRGQYEGNGIGLSLAKKIIERHHGRIWFTSEPGQGTTFYFTLPADGPA